MLTNKQMQLRTQNMQDMLCTDSYRFGEEIIQKNAYGQNDEGMESKIVLKRDNLFDMSFFLETLAQLFGRLHTMEGGTVISVNQNIWKQEIIRQIKNQITVYQQYEFNGALTSLFQRFSNEQNFHSSENIQMAIRLIDQELKKNFYNIEATKKNKYASGKSFLQTTQYIAGNSAKSINIDNHTAFLNRLYHSSRSGVNGTTPENHLAAQENRFDFFENHWQEMNENVQPIFRIEENQNFSANSVFHGVPAIALQQNKNRTTGNLRSESLKENLNKNNTQEQIAIQSRNTDLEQISYFTNKNATSDSRNVTKQGAVYFFNTRKNNIDAKNVQHTDQMTSVAFDFGNNKYSDYGMAQPFLANIQQSSLHPTFYTMLMRNAGNKKLQIMQQLYDLQQQEQYFLHTAENVLYQSWWLRTNRAFYTGEAQSALPIVQNPMSRFWQRNNHATSYFLEDTAHLQYSSYAENMFLDMVQTENRFSAVNNLHELRQSFESYTPMQVRLYEQIKNHFENAVKNSRQHGTTYNQQNGYSSIQFFTDLHLKNENHNEQVARNSQQHNTAYNQENVYSSIQFFTDLYLKNKNHNEKEERNSRQQIMAYNYQNMDNSTIPFLPNLYLKNENRSEKVGRDSQHSSVHKSDTLFHAIWSALVSRSFFLHNTIQQKDMLLQNRTLQTAGNMQRILSAFFLQSDAKLHFTGAEKEGVGLLPEHQMVRYENNHFTANVFVPKKFRFLEAAPNAYGSLFLVENSAAYAGHHMWKHSRTTYMDAHPHVESFFAGTVTTRNFTAIYSIFRPYLMRQLQQKIVNRNKVATETAISHIFQNSQNAMLQKTEANLQRTPPAFFMQLLQITDGQKGAAKANAMEKNTYEGVAWQTFYENIKRIRRVYPEVYKKTHAAWLYSSQSNAQYHNFVLYDNQIENFSSDSTTAEVHAPHAMDQTLLRSDSYSAVQNRFLAEYKAQTTSFANNEIYKNTALFYRSTNKIAATKAAVYSLHNEGISNIQYFQHWKWQKANYFYRHLLPMQRNKATAEMQDIPAGLYVHEWEKQSQSRWDTDNGTAEQRLRPTVRVLQENLNTQHSAFFAGDSFFHQPPVHEEERFSQTFLLNKQNTWINKRNIRLYNLYAKQEKQNKAVANGIGAVFPAMQIHENSIRRRDSATSAEQRNEADDHLQNSIQLQNAVTLVDNTIYNDTAFIYKIEKQVEVASPEEQAVLRERLKQDVSQEVEAMLVAKYALENAQTKKTQEWETANTADASMRGQGDSIFLEDGASLLTATDMERLYERLYTRLERSIRNEKRKIGL